MTAPATTSLALSTALMRRRELGEALVHLEQSVASAGTTPVDLVSAITGVGDGLRAHAAVVDDPEWGIFHELVARAPRLTDDVERLRQEHLDLICLAAETRATAQRLHDPPLPELLGFARGEAAALATALRSHLAVVADLIYESYRVELATGD